MTLLESFNIQFDMKEDGSFTATMPIHEFYTQHQGYVAGGVYLILAETAGGYASNLMGEKAEEKYVAVGQNINAHHVRPKKSDGGFITASGTLLHKGKSTHLWDIKITDENDKLISTVSVQNFIIQLGK
ncbi:PaaI family thioesterase [Actinomyces sp. zg-332]|uniref:PaaI family thioesterase n=1 Tax=Actinomyces sp. zg-332 TaxID=2708340 RepID=UPI00142379A6|nr:PaaI family thioesterase [Actinomyces sp. zg-332]QPK93842.1 PaaI family thioesterase [Actinomyces sp. zg-332]